MKNLTWQNPEQLFVAQELINKVKSKCCGIKDSFFKDKKYENYARVALDGYVEQNSIIKVKKLYKVAKIVVVSYNEIRKQLEKDNVIRGLSSGF